MMRNSEQNMNEHEIRRRVEQRLNERVELYIHATIYVVAIVAMWVLWALTGGLGIQILWPLLITFGWGIGLVAHGAKIYFTGAMDNIKEQEIDRALERERLRRSLDSEKRKNDSEPVLRLSDDGELVSGSEQEEPVSRKRATSD